MGILDAHMQRTWLVWQMAVWKVEGVEVHTLTHTYTPYIQILYILDILWNGVWVSLVRAVCW